MPGINLVENRMHAVHRNRYTGEDTLLRFLGYVVPIFTILVFRGMLLQITIDYWDKSLLRRVSF